MNDLQGKIKAAFDLISTIPVKQDSVEIMAAAKENLRQAYQMAAESEVKANGGQDDRGT